jgi:hypothetical protein
MSKRTIHWRTVWSNGIPTYVVRVLGATPSEMKDVEMLARSEGLITADDGWKPTEETNLGRLFQSFRAKEFDLKYESENSFDLERLSLHPNTRKQLEELADFTLNELAGFCPVQAEGEVDGKFFYFRARGSCWRIEIGGNESGTKGPNWWYVEDWPGETGFEAGYMSDEDVVGCLLRSVAMFRTSDLGGFMKGHPEYAKTILEGWSIGALSLQRAARRLGISGSQAVERATAYGIELPYYADQELKAWVARPSTIVVLDKATGGWRELPDEDA